MEVVEPLTQQKIIQFVPRKIDKDEAVIRPHYSTSASNCAHRAAKFSYSGTRREIYCRQCEEVVDTFEAFLLLGKEMNGIIWQFKEVRKFQEKEKLSKAIREAYAIQAEFQKPEKDRHPCEKCKLPLVKRRGQPFYQCFACGYGFRQEDWGTEVPVAE